MKTDQYAPRIMTKNHATEAEKKVIEFSLETVEAKKRVIAYILKILLSKPTE